MKTLLTGLILLVFAGSVTAQLPPDPPPIQRIEKLEDKTVELEKRIAVLEDKGTKAPKTTNEAVFGKPLPATTTRVAVGHTHTCVNGHTWDHTMDGGSHRCPICGQPQYVVDSVPKMVTGSPTVVYSQPMTTYQITPYSSGGCANGQCGSDYYSRGLFFRRWR